MTMYIRRLATFFFAVSVLGADGAKQPVQVTNTERVSFAPGGLIRLNTSSGNLMIEAWDRPEVEIATVKATRGSYEPDQKDQAGQCLASVRIVTARTSAFELAISDVLPSRSMLAKLFGSGCGVAIEHQIRVPRDSRLVIHHSAGYVLVSRVTGDIEATSRSGDIMLMLADPGPYSIDAKSKAGSVVSDFAGTTQSRKLVGEHFAGATPPAPSRRIYLRMGLGGITIKEVPPTPEAPLSAD